MKKSVVVKYTLFSLVVMFVLIAGVSNSFAGQGDRSVDVTAGFGTGPEDFDNGFGFGLGYGYEVNENVQARIDLRYFAFSSDKIDETASNIGIKADETSDFTNIPITIGGRYYFSTSDKLRVYGGLGLSFNLLKSKFETKAKVDNPSLLPFGLTIDDFNKSSSESTTKIGIEPAFGVEFMLSPTMSFGIDARYNKISDWDGGDPSFFSASGVLSFHL